MTEGKQRLAEGVGAWSTLGARAWLPCGLCLLAEAYILGRQYADGLEQVAQALDVAAEIGEQWYVPRLHHLRAEILQAQSRHSDAAEASLRTVIDIARAQGARGWELRAATGLARLWRDQGKGGKAHDLLAPIYGWFTEGLDTPDLKRRTRYSIGWRELLIRVVRNHRSLANVGRPRGGRSLCGKSP